MYAPIINQTQSLDDEEEERNDAVCATDGNEPTCYYNLNFEQARDFACFNNAVSTGVNPFKKRKSEAADGGGGGARVVHATGRKDRHSKVTTARGPRDRRVRLAPTTAIEFYDVQDRLGYDRPSKAIDWLIKEARAAIDALDARRSVNFTAAEEEENIRGGCCLSNPRDVPMREKGEGFMNVGGSLASSGSNGFVGAVAAPPPPYAAALKSTLQMPETNWEMARLQRMFAWNSVNESCSGDGGVEYASAAAQANAGYGGLVREPLQSSTMNNYSWINNNDFAGFNFSNELSKIAASSATPKQG